MRTGLLGKLTYANVVSTLALFLVLAGGVTVAAISGSGSAKFAGERGLETGQWVTVLNIAGLGKAQVRCDTTTSFGFKNTSAKTVYGSFLPNVGSTSDLNLGPGDRLDGDAGTSDGAAITGRFHVFRSGRPNMAEILVSSSKLGDACEDRHAVAQALTSE